MATHRYHHAAWEKGDPGEAERPAQLQASGHILRHSSLDSEPLPYAHADPMSGVHEVEGGSAGGGTHPHPGEENKEVPAPAFLIAAQASGGTFNRQRGDKEWEGD